MASARKRMKYDAGFKLKVVEFAKKTNNCAAAREFTISEKLVRDWRKAGVELRKMPKTKCAQDEMCKTRWQITLARAGRRSDRLGHGKSPKWFPSNS